MSTDSSEHSISITLDGSGFDNHSYDLESVYLSLLPEVGDIDGDSETTVEYDVHQPEIDAQAGQRFPDADQGCLRIEVEADSLTSLRAGLNTWLRLARTANEVLSLSTSD
ncbi:KEOPS complex subunit Pcc1 [Halorutilales archaeon Cl-col2-1]